MTSSSEEEPLKQANFSKEFEKFAGAKSYTDWVFEYVPPPAAAPAPVAPPKPPAQPPVIKTF